MKCSSCKQEIQTTFLGKLVGTHIKKEGKQYPICDECQRAFSKEELLQRI
jgi:ribosomal protein L34E